MLRWLVCTAVVLMLSLSSFGLVRGLDFNAQRPPPGGDTSFYVRVIGKVHCSVSNKGLADIRVRPTTRSRLTTYMTGSSPFRHIGSVSGETISRAGGAFTLEVRGVSKEDSRFVSFGLEVSHDGHYWWLSDGWVSGVSGEITEENINFSIPMVATGKVMYEGTDRPFPGAVVRLGVSYSDLETEGVGISDESGNFRAYYPGDRIESFTPDRIEANVGLSPASMTGSGAGNPSPYTMEETPPNVVKLGEEPEMLTEGIVLYLPQTDEVQFTAPQFVEGDLYMAVGSFGRGLTSRELVWNSGVRDTKSASRIIRIRDIGTDTRELRIWAPGYAMKRIPLLSAGPGIRDLGAIELEKGTVLRGRVTGSDNKPVAGARICAGQSGVLIDPISTDLGMFHFDPSWAASLIADLENDLRYKSWNLGTPTITQTATAGADGRFEIAGLHPDDNLILTVSTPAGGQFVQTQSVARLGRREVTIKMSPSGGMKLTVTSADIPKGGPSRWDPEQTVPSDDHGIDAVIWPVIDGVTDGDGGAARLGIFNLRGEAHIDGGSWSLEKSGLQAGKWRVKVTSRDATSVEEFVVVPGRATPLSVDLDQSGRLTVRVKSRSGEPALGVLVYLWGRNGSSDTFGTSYTTNDRGQVRFDGLKTGRYLVTTVNRTLPELQQPDEGSLHGLVQEVRIEKGSSNPSVDLLADFERHSYTVNSRLDSEARLTSVTLVPVPDDKAKSHPPTYWKSASSGDYWTMAEIWPGDYWVFVEFDGSHPTKTPLITYRRVTIPATDRVGPNVMEDFVSEPLVGKIELPAGHNGRGVKAWLRRLPEDPEATEPIDPAPKIEVTRGEDGRFEAPRQIKGRFQLVVEGPGLKPGKFIVETNVETVVSVDKR